MCVEQELFDSSLRDELAFEDVVYEFVDEVACKLRAELCEVLPRVERIIANQRHITLQVIHNRANIAALIANNRYILP